MKKKLLLITVLFCELLYSQISPQITVLTTTIIAGRAETGSIVYIDTDGKGNEEFKLTIDNTGKFSQIFNPALTSGNFVIIWSEDLDNKVSSKVAHVIKTDAEIIKEIINPISTKADEATLVEKMRAQDLSLANSVLTYQTGILNTNFSIPVARFNLSKDDASAKGNISLFSSIGAGIGLSWGRIEITRNNIGEVINEEFSNTFGIHAGILFSSGTGEDIKNVFAPTFNVSLLDIQFGVGHELGTVTENQKRTFFTLSYAIPLHKLIKKSYRVWWKNPSPIAVK